MYQLKEWSFSMDGGSAQCSGDCYGNPRFSDEGSIRYRFWSIWAGKGLVKISGTN